jgi:hypothetical protein
MQHWTCVATFYAALNPCCHILRGTEPVLPHFMYNWTCVVTFYVALNLCCHILCITEPVLPHFLPHWACIVTFYAALNLCCHISCSTEPVLPHFSTNFITALLRQIMTKICARHFLSVTFTVRNYCQLTLLTQQITFLRSINVLCENTHIKPTSLL